MYTELVMRTGTIEKYISSIFRKYKHLKKIHTDYAEAFEIHAAIRNIEYALKLLTATHNSVLNLISAEDKRESYRQKSYSSLSHRQMELVKLKESTDMLEKNLISHDFANNASSVMSKYLMLEERGNTIKEYIDFIIMKNINYTEMIFLDCTEALVLNAAIRDVEYSIKLLNATYTKRRALVDNGRRLAELKLEQLNSVSGKKDQLVLFKERVPMHEVFRNLGIHDIPLNEKHVAANQARIDSLHQDMNNLCAVFALHNIDPARCESVCNYCGIKNVFDMRAFSMSKLSVYAQEYDTPDYLMLCMEIKKMIANLSTVDFDFSLFCQQNSKCRPVRVNEMSRFEWQPYHSSQSLNTS